MEGLRKAEIYVRNVFAGILEETDAGYSFAYDPAYLQRPDACVVSLTLPLRPEPYTSHTLFSFFDGLIPEGWLLETVARNWKLDSRDRFGLLLVACRDGVGNVRVEEAGG